MIGRFSSEAMFASQDYARLVVRTERAIGSLAVRFERFIEQSARLSHRKIVSHSPTASGFTFAFTEQFASLVSATPADEQLQLPGFRDRYVEAAKATRIRRYPYHTLLMNAPFCHTEPPPTSLSIVLAPREDDILELSAPLTLGIASNGEVAFPSSGTPLFETPVQHGIRDFTTPRGRSTDYRMEYAKHWRRGIAAAGIVAAGMATAFPGSQQPTHHIARLYAEWDRIGQGVNMDNFGVDQRLSAWADQLEDD